MSDDHVTNTVATYDRIAGSYASDMNDFAPEVERKNFAVFLPKEGSVLDLGCAAGRDSIYFSNLGFHTIGVDLSEKLLAIAKERAPELTFLKQDVRNLEFPLASFDGIWACAILLHLTRDEIIRALKDCYRLLKPGGILFLMMKKGMGETDIAEDLSAGESRHFTLFQPEEIDTLLVEAGFHLLKTYSWNSKDRYTPARDVEWISAFAAK